MTVREKLEEMLTSRGMSNIQAKMVMDVAIPLIEKDEDYKIHFNVPYHEYEPLILNLLFGYKIKEIALEWIETNIPMAWFKPMFN